MKNTNKLSKIKMDGQIIKMKYKNKKKFKRKKRNQIVKFI